MKFSIDIDMDGVTAPNVIRAIRYALESWEEPDFRVGDAGSIIDKNGNMIGTWEITKEVPNREGWFRFR